MEPFFIIHDPCGVVSRRHFVSLEEAQAAAAEMAAATRHRVFVMEVRGYYETDTAVTWNELAPPAP